MFQRKQTLYMVVAILLLGLMYVIPLARYSGTGPDEQWALRIWGLQQASGELVPDVDLQVPFAPVVGVVILLLVITLVFYRNRPRQLRFARMSAVFVAAIGVALAITNGSVVSYLEQGRILTSHLTLGFFIPVPVLLLCIIALRGIRHDEDLVKSADRLR